jgi:membrane protease YdiL (CAAX protease family)
LRNDTNENPNDQSFEDSPSHRLDLFAVIFAIVLPTFVTLVYFKWLSDYSPQVQQTAFSIGKTIQFAFPIVWVFLFHRHKLSRSRNRQAQPSGNNALIAIGFGLAVVATMFAFYFGYLSSTSIADGLITEVKGKVSDLGVDSIWKYAALGIGYSLFHSFMEEYYWRWFVFDFLKKHTSVWTANIISSLGFMAHHVVLLSVYFGWDSPLTYLCSAGVAIGGIVWAWLYQRSGTLKWPWLSHLLVDAGIFGLGYFLVQSLY